MKPRPANQSTDFLPDADEIERWPLPWVARITLHSLAAMLLVFCVWASVFEVDRIVTAHGRLVTPLPNIVVQPLETSIIRSIDVRVGQVVRKGETLATMDPTFAEADETQLQERVKSLDVQTRRLQAELSGNTAAEDAAPGDARLQADLARQRVQSFKAETARMDEKIGGLRATIETNQHDQQILASRLKSLQEMEAMQEKLVAKGTGARVMLLEARDKRLGVERELQLAHNREQELRRDLAQAEAEKASFETNWRQKAMEELLSTARDRAALGEQLQKAARRREFSTLAAPADAVVLDIAKLSQGSVAREAEPLFTLVPLGESLEAEVQIDSIDVGYVKAGDAVRIKFDAFPFQRHGTIAGTVRTVSEDAFRREARDEGKGTEAFFLGRAELGAVTLRNLPDKARLLPGMTLSAEIVVGRRTVMSYLLWPLTKALGDSIREP